MPFLENLAEGLAGAAGDTGSVERIEKAKGRRQALSDAELEAQTQTILGDVSALQDRRSKLDPNSPTYRQDLQTIDQALHDARGVFTDLYHPENNPGALEKFGGFLKSHLGKRKGQPAPATPAAAKQSIADRMSGIETAAYGQSTPENPLIKQRRQLKEAIPGISDEDLNRATMIGAGVEAKPVAARPTWKLYISPDGKQRQYFDPGDLQAIPAGWMPVAPRAAQGNQPKVGSFGDFMTQAYGEHPTAENYEEGRRLWQQSGAATTVGEHIAFVPQKDGSILPITITTTSTKTFNQPQGGKPTTGQPGQTTPAPPKTPAEAKQRITPHAGVHVAGPAVGGRLTAPQTSAQKKYNEAVGFGKEVDDILARQAKGESVAIAQKRTLVKLERLSAGRFTTQAVDFIKKAGLGNTIQQWISNVESGELPPDVWRQVVQNVRDYEDSAKKELETSGITPPGGDQSKDLIQQLIDEANKNKKKPNP